MLRDPLTAEHQVVSITCDVPSAPSSRIRSESRRPRQTSGFLSGRFPTPKPQWFHLSLRTLGSAQLRSTNCDTEGSRQSAKFRRWRTLVFGSMLFWFTLAACAHHASGAARWSPCEEDVSWAEPPQGDARLQFAFNVSETTDFATSADGALFAITGSSSAQVWDVRSRRLVRAVTGFEFGQRVTLSPDGQRLAVAAAETIHIWDVVSGAPLRTVKLDNDDVHDVALASDGLTPFVVSTEGFGLIDGPGQRRTWTPLDSSVRSGVVSPRGVVAALLEDGRLVVGDSSKVGFRVAKTLPEADRHQSLSLSNDGTRVGLEIGGRIAIIDLDSGAELGRFDRGWSPALSDDGRKLAYLVDDSDYRRALVILDLETGARVQSPWDRGEALASSVAFVPGDRELLWLLYRGMRLHDVRTGVPKPAFQQLAAIPRWLAFDKSGANIMMLAGRRLVNWDLATGQPRAVTSDSWISSVAASLDHRRIIVAHEGGVELLDGRTGSRLKKLDEKKRATAVALSGDGRIAAIGSDSVTVRDLERDTVLLTAGTNGHHTLALTRDGRRLAVGTDPEPGLQEDESGAEASLNVIEVGTGKTLLKDDSSHSFHELAFSQDGRSLLVGALSGVIQVDLEQSRYDWHGDMIHDVLISPLAALSPDDRLIATSLESHVLGILDAATGSLKSRLVGHHSYIRAAAFSPDGRWVASGSEDGSAIIWELATGRKVATIATFEDGSWLVTDPAGRYDAKGGEVEGAHVVMNLEVIELAQLRGLLYEPNLLSKLLGLNDEPLLPARDLSKRAWYPDVRSGEPQGPRATLSADIVSRGGGIGRVELLLNGSVSELPPLPPSLAQCAHLDVDLKALRHYRPGVENTFELRATNSDGNLRSRSARGGFIDEQSRRRDPSLWAVVVGINDYRGTELDLKYPEKDAERFGTALALAAGNLFGADRVSVNVLRATPETRIDKARIREAFAQLGADRGAVHPEDIVVVFFAGHGVAHGSGRDEDFYFLTADAVDGSADLAPDVRAERTVSGRDLEAWLLASPAVRRVLILDTCASGRVIDQLSSLRAISSSQLRSLDRVRDHTGTWILAGAAADKPSYEASRYGHGLVTYSLLEAMKLAPELRTGELDVAALFTYAARRVPDLALGLRGRQIPQVRLARDAILPIGTVDAVVRDSIELAAPRPTVIRTQLVDALTLRDLPRRLGAKVDAHLAELSSNSAGRLMFADVAVLGDAYQLSGSYSLEGDSLVARGAMYQNDAERGHFELRAPATDDAALARAIATWFEARLVGFESKPE